MPDLDVEILLVEDNPRDAELTIRSLKKHNLAQRLHHVADGVEALDFILGTGPYAGRGAVHAPRLVLLDLKLPRLDGLEVLQRLKADERTKSIPVVMLTSSREERDLEASYRMGVNSYVVKPVEFETYADAVAQLGLYWLLRNEPPSRG